MTDNGGIDLKKTMMIIMLTALCICAAAVSAAAAELEFTPVGGGKYLYNNNPEGIDDQMTVSSDNPRYISSHEHLTPDEYYLYMSYFNYTGSGKRGYDIEVDVEITAKQDAVITINNASFEVGRSRAYMKNGAVCNEISDWTFTGVCADMLGEDIIDMSGRDIFKARSYEPVTVEIKAGETLWLSDYLNEYDKVPFAQPVHFQADITLEDGIVDINTLAKKYNGILKDRSDIPENIAFGIYRYDYTLKGIADTLPEVETDLMHFTIDDSMESGERLPVTVKNQYVPDGNTVYTWVTNINPVADKWSKNTAAESDMLSFKYEDDNKLSYYGKDVSRKNNVWIFDTKHAACSGYDSRSGKSADEYEPNFVIDDIFRSDIATAACNLGNYGVTETYRLEVENSGDRDRYFNYTITSKSNVIVYTSDEDGAITDAYSKSTTGTANETVMASVLIPARETVRFSVSSQLPVNVNGGLQNSFVISDTYDIKYTKYTEKDYFDPFAGKRISDVRAKLPEKTLEEFGGSADSFEIVDGYDTHLVRWCEWDGNPYFYTNVRGYCNTVYALNDRYEIIARYQLPTMPVGIAIVDGVMYVRDMENGLYLSYDDGMSWSKAEYQKIPEKSFEALTVSDWARGTIRKALSYGIIPEELKTDEKRFDEPINRRDFCYLAYEMMKKLNKAPGKSENTFEDCDDDIISALSGVGIIEGTSAVTFEPEKDITREQAAVIMSRTAGYLGIQLDETPVDISDEISDWAVMAVYKMYNAGFMNGTGNSEFNAYGSYTKEQAAAVCLRLYESLLANDK